MRSVGKGWNRPFPTRMKDEKELKEGESGSQKRPRELRRGRLPAGLTPSSSPYPEMRRSRNGWTDCAQDGIDRTNNQINLIVGLRRIQRPVLMSQLEGQTQINKPQAPLPRRNLQTQAAPVLEALKDEEMETTVRDMNSIEKTTRKLPHRIHLHRNPVLRQE